MATPSANSASDFAAMSAVLLGLVAGLAWPVLLPTASVLLATGVASATLILLLCAVLWRYKQARRHGLLLLLLCFAAGTLYHGIWAQRRLQLLNPDQAIDQPVLLRLCIKDSRPLSAGGVAYTAALLEGESRHIRQRLLSLRDYSGSYRPRQWQAGAQLPRRQVFQEQELISANVALSRVRSRFNVGEPDYEGLAFADSQVLRGTLRRLISRTPASSFCANSLIENTRDLLLSRIGESRNSEQSKAILGALLAGQDRAISDGQWALYRQTGTLHLLVVSGLHMVLVAGFMFGLARLLIAALGGVVLGLQGLQTPRLASLFAIVATLAYATLSGWGLPTQRAFVMTAVLFGLGAFGLRIAATQRLLMGLVAVLLADPLASLRSGFWYSFIAVAALFVCLPRSGADGAAGDSVLRRAVRGGLGLLKVQLLLSVALLLPGLYFGSAGTVLSLPANFVAVPVVGMLALPTGLLGAVLSLLGGGQLLLNVSGFLLAMNEAMLGQLVAFVSSLTLFGPTALPALRWPTAFAPGQRVMQWALVTGALTAVTLLLLPGLGKSRLLALVLALGLVRPHKMQNDSWLHVLDVGQGAAAVVQRADRGVLVDTGYGRRLEDQPPASMLVPSLLGLGIRQLDTVILSHSDADHAGGLAGVLANFPVGQVIANPEGLQLADSHRRWLGLPASAVAMKDCRALLHYDWQGLRFQSLSAGAEQARSRNDGSCVFHLRRLDQADARVAQGPKLREPTRHNGPAVFLPGDIGAMRERLLAQHYGSQLASSLILAPHHGSRSSSSFALIKQVNPAQVIFSAGFANAFGHPHPAIVERYQQLGVQTWETADSGMLSFQLNWNPRRPPLQQRKIRRAYWRSLSRGRYQREPAYAKLTR